MLVTWPEQAREQMCCSDGMNYLDLLLHSSFAARECRDIAANMLKSYEALATCGASFECDSIKDVVPAGFTLSLPTPGASTHLIASAIANSNAIWSEKLEEATGDQLMHNAETTLMLDKIPRHWDFTDIIETLSKHGVDKYVHYDCICIPTVQEASSRCAFINATSSEARRYIFGVLNGLHEAADGSILVPPLALTVAKSQGLAFYVDSYPCDSMFFCGAAPDDMPVQSCSVMLQECSGDGANIDTLLKRLMQGDATQTQIPQYVSQNHGQMPPACMTKDVCNFDVDQESLLKRLLEDNEKLGTNQVKQDCVSDNLKKKTTVCIKGLSKYTTASDFLNLLSSQLNITEGKDIDFLYIPIDFNRGVSKGYAIVNFREESVAKHLVESNAVVSFDFATKPILWANVQGFETNAKLFLARHHRVRNPRGRPLIWRHESSISECLTLNHIKTFQAVAF